MKKFELGKTYFAKYKIRRVFFKVVERTSCTVTLAYVGMQNEGGNFHPHAIDVAGNGDLQEIQVHIASRAITIEYGYVKVEDENPWSGKKFTAREVILASNEAHLPA